MSNPDHLFSAEIHQAKLISDILTSLKLGPTKKRKEILWALCEISQDGIKITVEQDKCMQAITVLKKNMDAICKYRFAHDVPQIQFQFPLQYLIDCLNLHGSAESVVQICYPGPDGSLSLLVTEGSVLTDCNIKTKDISDEDSISDFHFSDHPQDAKILMKSSVLREALSELEWLDSSTITLSVIAANPTNSGLLSLSTDGDAGNLTVNLKEEVFASFTAHANREYAYKSSHFMRVKKALVHSIDTGIRLNSVGTLSIQAVYQSPSKQNTFVEFFMLAEYTDQAMNHDESQQQEEEEYINLRHQRRVDDAVEE